MRYRGGNERERRRENKYTGFMQEAMRPPLPGRAPKRKWEWGHFLVNCAHCFHNRVHMWQAATLKWWGNTQHWFWSHLGAFLTAKARSSLIVFFLLSLFFVASIDLVWSDRLIGKNHFPHIHSLQLTHRSHAFNSSNCYKWIIAQNKKKWTRHCLKCSFWPLKWTLQSIWQAIISRSSITKTKDKRGQW